MLERVCVIFDLFPINNRVKYVLSVCHGCDAFERMESCLLQSQNYGTPIRGIVRRSFFGLPESPPPLVSVVLVCAILLSSLTR